MRNNTIFQEKNHTVFAPDRVGALMLPRPETFAPDRTVDQVIARLREMGEGERRVERCYVTDDKGRLLGQASFRRLVLAAGEAPMGTVMKPPFLTVCPEDDRETAAQMMEQFDLLELPVVDGRNRLVGLVTADDAMAVLQDEATEDMERMAAMAPSETPYLQTRVVTIFRSRILWLLLLMLSATFTGAIISGYEDALAAQVALTAFIPMLMDTGGNCGSQSSVTVIRGLSLGEIHLSDWARVCAKEGAVALLCGGVLGAVTLLRILLLNHLSLAVAATVALTLVLTVLISKLMGCLLPLAARRAGLDPAVMAGPLITTVVDAAALLIYFRTATLLLGL